MINFSDIRLLSSDTGSVGSTSIFAGEPSAGSSSDFSFSASSSFISSSTFSQGCKSADVRRSSGDLGVLARSWPFVIQLSTATPWDPASGTLGRRLKSSSVHFLPSLASIKKPTKNPPTKILNSSQQGDLLVQNPESKSLKLKNKSFPDLPVLCDSWRWCCQEVGGQTAARRSYWSNSSRRSL